MTNQEIFDHVLNKIREQGGFSWSEEEELCMYRGDGGCKCAVGWLIPDDMYDGGFEGFILSEDSAWNDEKFKRALCVGCGREERDIPVSLLISLQEAHDKCACESYAFKCFEEKMKGVARRFGLRYEAAGEAHV